MKLLHCIACGDIRRLHVVARRCRCERSRGIVGSDGKAEILGPARVLAMTGAGGARAERAADGWWTALPEHSDVERREVQPLL